MLAFIRRVYASMNPTAVPKTDAPLRFGILGAANIAPLALIIPAKSHSDVEIHAVAAREQVRADAYAKKHGIPVAYGGEGAYEALLRNPDIDVVYNPLPNGLHYEWTMKALAAGKHVLLEKPAADTEEEVRKMFEFAEKKGLVLMEAWHYQFHPATQRAKAIIDSGEIGELKHVHASFALPGGFFKDNDIRFNYDLGGGNFMDMGCYCLSVARYFTSADPVRVVSAKPDTLPKFSAVDVGIRVEAVFPAPSDGAQEITSTLDSHFMLPAYLGIIPRMPEIFVRVEGTRGELYYSTFVAPFLYHAIYVTGKDGQKRTEKEYGIVGWSTYRYQLESFVDRLRGRTPGHWHGATDSIKNARWIERVYEASGLGVRPTSKYNVLTA